MDYCIVNKLDFFRWTNTSLVNSVILWEYFYGRYLIQIIVGAIGISSIFEEHG